MLDVIVMGEALWDLAAPTGSFADAHRLDLRLGGGAVNVALQLRRSGLEVAVAACIGRDALGEAFLTRLGREGIDTSLVRRTDARMGLVFAEDEPRRFVSYRASDEPPPELPPDWNARALVLSGLTPELVGAFAGAAREGQARGAKVVLDVNARPRVWRGRDRAPRFALLVNDVDVWKASEDDLATLQLDEADVLMEPARACVVTRGAGQATAAGSFGRVDVAPPPVAGARNPMGAGDAFTAGLVQSLLDAPDAGWQERLAHAHATARKWLSRSG